MSSPDLAIIGGGILGRLLAWRAALAGVRVKLFDAGPRSGESSAAWAAAGMLAPSTEAADANAVVASMGRDSLELWESWLPQLPCPVFFRKSGTLLFWENADTGAALRFKALLQTNDPAAKVQQLGTAPLRELEPDVQLSHRRAFLVEGEGQVDNRELLSALADALEELHVPCYWHQLIADDQLPKAGLLIDCRGMGAASALPDLRGVRGEIIRLHAPEITLHHMLRLLNPRRPVYIVPRSEGRLVVGATVVESEDRSPVSVRGAIELLSAATSLLPELATARILELNTQIRPALQDNLPRMHWDQGCRVLRLNGLYRHGFLISPAMVEKVLSLLREGSWSASPSRWSLVAEPAIHSDERSAAHHTTEVLAFPA